MSLNHGLHTCTHAEYIRMYMCVDVSGLKSPGAIIHIMHVCVYRQLSAKQIQELVVRVPHSEEHYCYRRAETSTPLSWSMLGSVSQNYEYHYMNSL